MANETTFKGLTRIQLLNLVEYDPETGAITSKLGNKVKNYTNARYGYKTVYLSLATRKIYCLAHRLAWFLIHGEIDPELDIDHQNGIRGDNRLANLRLVTARENSRNRRRGSNNPSGVMGVRRSQTEGKWVVQIVGKYYGTFESVQKAAVVANKMYEILGFHPNHGKEPIYGAATEGVAANV